jgi:hypothetical protein
LTVQKNDIEPAQQLRDIGGGFYMSEVSGGVYETTKETVEPDAGKRNVGPKPWARWGPDNNYPQRLIDAVMADPAATELSTPQSLHYGLGCYFFRKKVDEKGNERIEYVPDEQVPAEIEDFLWMNDWANFIQGVIADFEWWHAYYSQYVRNGLGKVAKIKWHRMKDCRPELRNRTTGSIDNIYLSGMWPNPVEGEFIKVPTFDPRSESMAGGMYKHQLVSIDKDYFPQPGWHGINRWLHLASKIPRWILANIDNSINIKYHVKIPFKYFQDRCPVENYKNEAEQRVAIAELEQDTYKKIDGYLAGEKNVHKAFYSKFTVDDNGKPTPGWEIIVIDNKIQDKVWLEAYGTASMAITSGFGLSPSISGKVLPNGLGSGSGSDLREQFNFQMQVKTARPRQTTLEPWEIIKRLNKWPKDLHMGYRNVILESTDKNPTGYTKQKEEAPTSQND